MKITLNMNTLILILLISLSVNAAAAEEAVKAWKDHIHKLSKYFEKNRLCEIAFISSYEWHRKNGPSDNPFDEVVVNCIADVVLNKNTINETSGCSSTFFNATKGHFTSGVGIKSYGMVNKKCSEGGLEELMQKKYLNNLTVEYWTFHEEGRYLKVRTLLYASRPGFNEWFNKVDKKYFESHKSAYLIKSKTKSK